MEDPAGDGSRYRKQGASDNESGKPMLAKIFSALSAEPQRSLRSKSFTAEFAESGRGGRKENHPRSGTTLL